MATTEAITTISLQAAADLSALQFTCVITNAAGKAAAAGAGANVTGVLLNKPVADQAGTIGVAGIVKVKAGAAVAAGAKVMCDATGRVITAVGAAGNHVVGVAMESSAAANEIIRVAISVGNKGILA